MILSVSENLSINIIVDNYTELEDFQPCFNQQTHSVLGSVSEISPTPISILSMYVVFKPKSEPEIFCPSRKYQTSDGLATLIDVYTCPILSGLLHNSINLGAIIWHTRKDFQGLGPRTN